MVQTEIERPTAVRSKERDASLDLVRALAGYLVISIHFFLNNEYYAQPMEGGVMLLATAVRMAFASCVPLFLLLTGCLCRGKTLSARYYLGLIHVLLSYLLCGLCCTGVQLFRGQALGMKEIVKRFLNYSAAPYAWYIEMYIGLFLLIPFLNLIWKGLESKKQRGALVLTLLFLTALPTLTNLRHSILPDWWVNLYPVTYYFLGAWLGEYRPKLDWRWGLPAWAGVVLAEGGLLFRACQGGTYQWNIFGDWSGLGVVVSTCLLFLLVRQIPAVRFPRWSKRLIRKGAELSLGVYLVSWCFDSLFYPILNSCVPVFADRLPWYFVIVPAVYLCSALCAQAMEWLRRGIAWCLNKLFPKLHLS